MTTRFASLLAAAALCVSAASAMAQDWDDRAPPLPELEHQGYGDGWDEYERDEYEDEYHEDDDRSWPDARRSRGDDREHRRGGRHEPRSRFAYSEDQRADWLDRCRSNQYGDGEGRERGALIGGALGALGGGIAGNRIAGRGDRLEGTLLGAGAGAVAGAAVGSLIGAGVDRERGADFCEDYLARYEDSATGYGHHAYAGSPYGMGPVMWVRVPIIRERRDCGCEEVIEQVIVEEVAAPARRARRVAPRPEKRVRYAK